MTDEALHHVSVLSVGSSLLHCLAVLSLCAAGSRLRGLDPECAVDQSIRQHAQQASALRNDGSRNMGPDGW